MSTYVVVSTSPATWTWPVVIMVSTATLLRGSPLIIWSRMASLIWSAILSGCPSVTDSEVNRRLATVLPDGSPGRRSCERGCAVDTEYPATAVKVSERNALAPALIGRAATRSQSRCASRSLDTSAIVDFAAVGDSTTAALWSTANPRPSPTSLTTSRSQPLRRSFSRPWRSTSSVSAANPTITGRPGWPPAAAGARRDRRARRDCGSASSGSGSASSTFLILVGGC